MAPATIWQAGASPVVPESKRIDSRYSERLNRVSRQLEPYRRALDKALTNGQWQYALEIADTLEMLWQANGVSHSLNRKRIEALVGLGRTEEALLIFTKGKPITKPTGDVLYFLALALEGKLDKESVRRMSEHVSRAFGGTRMIPEDPSKEDLIVLARIARALDAGLSYPVRMVREARAALDLEPDNPAAAFLIAEALQHLGDHEGALPYFRIASKLPGKKGVAADAVVRASPATVTMTTDSR
jgi:tetratricopeptide (TPR) repeat protein